MFRKKKQPEKIKILVFVPGEEAKVARIDNTLEAMQYVVDGYIETVNLDDGGVLLCDEEGVLKGKIIQYVPHIGQFAGTVFICGRNEDEFADIPEEWLRAFGKVVSK